MTLNQLRYFVKVAENGHLTRSAAELMIDTNSFSGNEEIRILIPDSVRRLTL